ncbi:hypothetical protein B0H34DRAFT_809931 [Crassisporium funariophilum]|nr:hypothetical protein B0H34DRAFT_809931 [Crassisporium funariophilum]
MHFTSFIPLLSVVLLIPAVPAYPVGNSLSGSNLGRDIPGVEHSVVLRSNEEFYARTLGDLFKKKPLTEEQKTVKEWRKNGKAHKALGKEISKEAKAELGKDHHVQVSKFTCAGCGSNHGALQKTAEKKAHKEWKNNGNLQQYRKVDIHVTPGEHKDVISAKYHNGGMEGATFTFQDHHKGKK